MRITKLITLAMLILGVGLFFGCEGPEGPAGPAGADGADGMNAAETCTDCHNNNSALITAQLQYSYSQHGLGVTFERNGADCARCHTHQGFLAVYVEGEADATVENPTHINVRRPGYWTRLAREEGYDVVAKWYGEVMAHIRYLPQFVEVVSNYLDVNLEKAWLLRGLQQSLCLVLRRP